MKLNEMYSAEDIRRRVAQMGEEISNRFQGKELEIVCVLKGGVFFAADLVRALSVPCRMNFIKVKSYEGTCSTGDVKISFGDELELAGRNVLIVEDILDTGRTLKKLTEKLWEMKPQSLVTAVFLDKKARRETDFEADYAGFEIEDKFVVGYGMDCDEKYRELPFVAELSDTEK